MLETANRSLLTWPQDAWRWHTILFSFSLWCTLFKTKKNQENLKVVWRDLHVKMVNPQCHYPHHLAVLAEMDFLGFVHTFSRVFSKTEIFPPYLKNICVYTQRFWIVCAEERALNLGMTSSYLKTSVFALPHEYAESPFSKMSTPEGVFENLRFQCPKTPVTCGR